MIRKVFEGLEFEYFPTRDVYEVYYKGKIIHAVFAYRNANEIIDEIRVKREGVIWGSLR